MMESEIQVKVLSNENKRLRHRLFTQTIVLYAVLTVLIVFLVIAAILATTASGG